MKKCKACNNIIPIELFYKNSKMADGILNTCKACVKVAHQKYRRENLELLKLRRKELYQKTRQESISKAVEWSKQNKDKRKVYKRNWYEKNRELIYHYSKERRGRERGATGRHTMQEWKDLCMLTGGKCARCLSSKPLTRDHIIPLSLGGSNSISNIQPLCLSCNSSKRNFNSNNYMMTFTNNK